MPELEEPIVASPEQNEDQYRSRAGLGVSAPVTAGDFAGTAVSGIAMPLALSHLVRGGKKLVTTEQRNNQAKTVADVGLRPEALKKLHQQWTKQKFSTQQRIDDLKAKARPGVISPNKAKRLVDYSWRKANPMPTLAGVAKNFIMRPLPDVAVNEMFGLADPFNDPKYKSGERGFLSSWWKAQQHKADRLGERGQEAREAYGVAGVPVQMLHGLMNPVSSLLYGGTALKNYFSGKQAALNVERAESSVRRALS